MQGLKQGQMVNRVLLLTMLACHLAWAGERPPRIWILPFDNPHAEASLQHLQEAIPALLSVTISQSDPHAMVDRQHLHQVLAEQSLSLEGLTATFTRQEVGRLLGATVLITGSLVKQGEDLLITIRASDVETGRVTATAEARGPDRRLSQLLRQLYGRLAGQLGRQLPALGAAQIDTAPLSNLHFMRGLGYYYSARYNQALAAFMQAAREAELTDISRLWLANAYLAQDQYGHAYLELSKLKFVGSRSFRPDEVEAKLRACETYLSPEAVQTIRQLAAPQAPVVE
jgi:TolB-like protein